MRLRQRLQDQFHDRMRAHLPDAMVTAWDAATVVLAVEQLLLNSDGSAKVGWHAVAGFTGIAQAELRGDDIDSLAAEALIGSLITSPLTLVVDDALGEGCISEAARAVLFEMRDTVRDSQIVTLLRFRLSGQLMRRAYDPVRPLLLASAAPQIGPGHADDYAAVVQP